MHLMMMHTIYTEFEIICAALKPKLMYLAKVVYLHTGSMTSFHMCTPQVLGSANNKRSLLALLGT